MPTLPEVPGASAYHDINGTGVPFAFCAVTTWRESYGPSGVSVDASHEILETAGDQGANQWADDTKGTLHAYEMCDAVEVQTYGKTCADGTVVQVSNWLLRSWFNPNAICPLRLHGVRPASRARSLLPGRCRLLGNGGNYQIIRKSTAESDSFASRVEGKRRKGKVQWSSRAGLRMAACRQPLRHNT